MKGNFKAPAALALLDSATVPTAKVQAFGRAVAKEFSALANTERTNARRAILIGLALPIIKASLPRGEFEPWKKANLTQGKIWTPATALKNASFYARLSLQFLQETKPTADEVLSVTAGQAVQGKPGKDKHAAELLKRIDAFCGERTLTELLDEYGIRTPGTGASRLGGGETPALTAGGDDNALLQDAAEWITNLRKTVTDPDQLKRFTPAAISALEKELADILEDCRRAREQMKATR